MDNIGIMHCKYKIIRACAKATSVKLVDYQVFISQPFAQSY